MTQWTTFIIKRPRCVLATWLVLLAAGGWAAAHLADQLSTRFSVPGADSERGLALLEAQMGARSDGAFTLVATGVDSATDRAAVLAAARRAARAVRGGTVGRVLQAAPGITAVQLSTPLDSHAASLQTTHLRRAIGDVAGVRTYLSGYPAIDHDSQRIYNADLRRGEVIAVPVALAVLALIFGSLGAVVVPVAFAAATIPTTLGIVWLLAHVTDMATYVTNIVVLIGLAIAVDYSMLVVSRYRQELRRTADPQAALLATMATAGRTTLFSGATVAIGLALLVLVPVPFMRSMGIGGLVVPLVSIAAAATLLPALLAVIGPRVDRLPLVSRAARPAT